MVIAALLMAVQASPFQFGGGSPQDLARALSLHYERPTILAVTEKKLGALTVAWPKSKDETPLARQRGLARQFKITAKGLSSNGAFGTIACLRPSSMPWYRFRRLSNGRNGEVEFPGDATLISVTNGRVTANWSRNSFYVPAHLPFGKFSKKISCHRFLAMTPLVFAGASLSVDEFVQAVAFAIGGKVVESERTVFIDVDMRVFRSQMIALFEQLGRTTDSQVVKAKAAYQAEAIRIAKEEDLRRMVDLENTLTVFALPQTSKAQELAMAYTKLYVAEAEKKEGRDPNVSPAVAERIKTKGNLNRAFRVSLDTAGGVDVMVMYGNDAGGIGY